MPIIKTMCKTMSIKVIAVMTIFFVCTPFLFAEKTLRYTATDKKRPDFPDIPAVNQIKRWRMSDYNLPWLISDVNKDGIPDAVVKLSASNKHRKVVEVLDSNFDGIADDFSFYNLSGKILYQEIDSNYDRKIDLWINVLNGKYIKRYQKDSDFDGYVDIDRDFTK